MTLPQVATFTDTYLPTVNGVTYTIDTWRDRWQSRGGRMDVVYPRSDYEPDSGEHPVRSLPFPFYEGFRVGLPQVPSAVEQADVVHAHTPFGLGLAGWRFARKHDVPLVASYHTPTAEYADYISTRTPVNQTVSRAAATYERRFLNRVDAVIVPSEDTAAYVREHLDVSADVEVIPNGVDTEFFTPTADGNALRDRYDLPDGTLVGYTGRHGHEKRLDVLVEAVAEMGDDITLVFGGDGPARDEIEAMAADLDVDARFLGFLPREELPALYATLDAFGFPSPVETQGLVALEATACGTPVAGVNEGALTNTIVEGRNGYTADAVTPEALSETIRRVLDDQDTLETSCCEMRDEIAVESAVDDLTQIYKRVRGGATV